MFMTHGNANTVNRRVRANVSKYLVAIKGTGWPLNIYLGAAYKCGGWFFKWVVETLVDTVNNAFSVIKS